MADIYIDIAELLGNPLRTGIQRVVRELLSHWPADRRALLVRYDATRNQLLAVDRDVIDWVLSSGLNPYLREDVFRARLQQVLSEGAVVPLEPQLGDWLLTPELFVSLQRGKFYEAIQARGVRVAMIVHDFIAWLSPNQVSVEKTGGLNHYLEVLKKADRRCFVSSMVREHYYTRMLRRPLGDDAVIPLGADGLRRGAAVQSSESAPFVVPGALDGRKGQDLVYEAFRSIEASIEPSIVFAGRVPAQPRPHMRPLLTSNSERVRIMDDPDDAALASLMAGARGCFFISRYEGFGLPALESLYLGAPTVVSASLPSMADIPSLGQIRLKSVTETTIADAMRRLANPAEVEKLREEARRLKLRTWKDYAASVADWLSD